MRLRAAAELPHPRAQTVQRPATTVYAHAQLNDALNQRIGPGAGALRVHAEQLRNLALWQSTDPREIRFQTVTQHIERRRNLLQLLIVRFD